MRLPESHDELMDLMLGGTLSNEKLLEIAKSHSHLDFEQSELLGFRHGDEPDRD